MSHILLFGVEPLPDDSAATRLAGAGWRTWHILKALQQAQHTVTLLTNRTHGAFADDLPSLYFQQRYGIDHYSMDDAHWHDLRRMCQLITAIKADAAVAVGLMAGAVAARSIGELPLWIDLYGDPLAEAQQKARLFHDDDQLLHYWQQYLTVLHRGDIFSAVSERGSWAVIGALAASGRLNKQTAGYSFVHVISVGTLPTQHDDTGDPRRIKGQLVPANAFVILLSGSFNTWLDIDTMFDAVTTFMAQHPHAYLIALGGATPAHDERTYQRFQERIVCSPFRSRFILREWIATSELPHYYAAADVAVCADLPCYEAHLGSRTRVLDWLQASIPCLLSDLPELAGDLADAQAALTFPAGDIQTLTEHLQWCVQHPAERCALGRRGYDYCRQHYSITTIIQPLLRWAAQPTPAPDRGAVVPLFRPALSLWQHVLHALRQRRFNLALGLRLWHIVAVAIPPRWQQSVKRWGLRALRLNTGVDR